ncbi:beta carbonic anhydrase 5, chloroplastic-like isoform X2 [Panicum virgatum]|uniref:beta carbonic anhydrase 5, chloroplastic-like isoform X2 n=1 Tax=Panicum virgatum TaxID=38727 RepID=UPI0019D5C974|nr:beta carbonic anhydrase 5, chloroplastic-like isoform X2 [Panicum virgatum]
MLPRSLGPAARRLGLVAAAAPSTARASSASAARRPCPPSDGDEAGEDDEPLPLRTPHGPPAPEERRWPRRGEQRRVMLKPIVEAPSIINKTTRAYGRRQTQLLPRNTIRREFSFITTAAKDHSVLTRQLLDSRHDTVDEVGTEHDPFIELKARFMDFKQRNYVENFSNYQSLAQQQTPKFMVIACADSRVCPTSILGFQPGEAFTVRNVANLVPPYEHGGSETSAALEFAVNTLQVENVLVVGHSRCGGIQALMSMKDDSTSGFIKNWVSIGKSARLSTKAAAGNLSFEMQCTHCEKESINSSLLNLLTYPWIEKRVNEGTLNLHGGYYNFVDCTFEKWTLVYREGLKGGSKYAIKNRSSWS